MTAVVSFGKGNMSGVAKKGFGVTGVARKVFLRSGTDDSAPLSSDKIRAKILDLGYGGARRAFIT